MATPVAASAWAPGARRPATKVDTQSVLSWHRSSSGGQRKRRDPRMRDQSTRLPVLLLRADQTGPRALDEALDVPRRRAAAEGRWERLALHRVTELTRRCERVGGT